MGSWCRAQRTGDRGGGGDLPELKGEVAGEVRQARRQGIRKEQAEAVASVRMVGEVRAHHDTDIFS